MLNVHIKYHKDGDKLAIVHAPWWANIYEKFVSKFCPCCSWRGWFWDKVTNFESDDEKKYKFKEKFYLKYFDKWSHIYMWTSRFETVLYETPITDACLASQKIFQDKQPCWRDDCEYCLELREDGVSLMT